LFSAHSAPIVEKFDSKDRLDQKLLAALDELVAQEIGAGAMTASLLKQVLITVFRRSMGPLGRKIFRIAWPSCGMALAEMAAKPGARHTLQSLAEISGLSRSGFIERFTRALGCTPMAVLRQLRLRRAAQLLSVDGVSVEQAANAAGYQSRSSFIRAFRNEHGCDPSEYGKAADEKASMS
jgi:transcriptional regulator GlxA family with amidase domain